MSKNQPPRVQFDFEPDLNDFEEVDCEAGAQSIDAHPSITASIDDEDSESVMLPEVIEEPIVEKEIFDMAENIKEPAVKEPQVAVQKKPVKMNKNGKPRKQMSEAHKQKLAASREKALQARKQKAEERKKAKELEKEERELLKAQKVKRVQKLREEVNDEAPAPAPTPAPVQQSTQSFSREDLERAQLDAIIKYEALRKSRKEEKRKKEMLEKQQQDMRNKIKRATEPQQYKYRDGSNLYDRCY